MHNTPIIRPIITEQSMKNTQKGVFTFEVQRFSHKASIRVAIERLYAVHVEHVTTHIRSGKIKRTGRKRIPVRRPDRKIARVQLAAGEKINAFELANV